MICKKRGGEARTGGRTKKGRKKDASYVGVWVFHDLRRAPYRNERGSDTWHTTDRLRYRIETEKESFCSYVGESPGWSAREEEECGEACLVFHR